MADENPAPVVDDVKVDESSVKPDLARRNSLEKHLAHRPERAELIESKTHPRTLLLYWNCLGRAC